MARYKIDAIIDKAGPQVADLISRHKRHSDAALYSVLADCMRVCEACAADPKEFGHLNDLLRLLPRGNRNRRTYVERASDVYQRVARYVFRNDENYANINRYAIAMREAARQGVRSGEFSDRLMRDGGVNKLFLSRSGQSPIISTRCIRLAEPVVHRKSEVLTLRLRRRADNVYEVLDTPSGTC